MDGSQGVRQDGVHLHGRRRVGGEVQGRLPPAQVSRPHQTSLCYMPSNSALMFELWSFVSEGRHIDIECMSCVANA